MHSRNFRLHVRALAVAALSAATLWGEAEAQAQWNYAKIAQYQIRQLAPGQGCPPGFGTQTFNYAGWGVRTYCIMCPASYFFVQTAGTYACAYCPPGTAMSSRSGYSVCVK